MRLEITSARHLLRIGEASAGMTLVLVAYRFWGFSEAVWVIGSYLICGLIMVLFDRR